MAGLPVGEEESGLGDEVTSDENSTHATRGHLTPARHKDLQKREQEQLRIAMEEMNGTMNTILKGLDSLQRSSRSRTMDEALIPRNVRARTRDRERMRKGGRFSLDDDNDYDEKIPTLVNTLNKLVNRMDSLNHQLQTGKISLCCHACNLEQDRNKSDSASCANIMEYADDNEHSIMKSANYGTHGKIKQVAHNMTKESMQVAPQDRRYESKTEEPHPSPQFQTKPMNVSEQKTHSTANDKLAETSSSSGNNQLLLNVPKKMDIKEDINKMDDQGKPISSVKGIVIDSSGLKSIQTDPREDNRRKDIKKCFQPDNNGKNKDIKPKTRTRNNMNCNDSHMSNFKKNEDIRLKEHTKYSDGQTKEMTSSTNIHQAKDHNNVESNVSDKQSGGTISGPVVSHTPQILKNPEEALMISSHLPQEYWDSIAQETFEKAKIIMTSRSIGFDTIICLDTSMSVAEYWGDILDFLRNLISEIDMTQPMEGGLMEHIAVVTFGHETCVLQHFNTNYQEVLTKIHLINPEGSTPMYWALNLCEAILSGSAYAPILRDVKLAPRLLLITDGRPTCRFWAGGQDMQLKSDEEREKEDVARMLIILNQKIPLLRVYPVTVGNNCDMYGTPVQIALSYLTRDLYPDSWTILTFYCEHSAYKEFLSAIADSSGGKVMTLSDWPEMAHFGKKMELASKYFGLASLSEEFLTKVLTEKSGLAQEEIEFITSVAKDQIEYQNDEGYTSDEKEVEGSYQFPPVGSRVRRGPDWNRKDEDNDSAGTLYGYAKGKAFSGWVMVQWDKPKKYGRWRFRYRYGAENAHDIKIQANEGPREMDTLLGVKTGCEVIRGRYQKSSDKEVDDVEEGSIGIVYEILTIGGSEVVLRVRWNNGKRVTYRNGAPELELSPRSRPNLLRWPFGPLLPLHNPLQSPRQPSMDNYRQQPPRREALPPSRGQSLGGEEQNSDGPGERNWNNQNSDSDTEERGVLTIENVERHGMPSVDDMNIRNQILTRRKEARNKQTFVRTRNSSYSNTIFEPRMEAKSDTHTVTQEAESYDNPKKSWPKRRNKNADV